MTTAEALDEMEQKRIAGNRIQVVNWRGHGDDEAYAFTTVIAAGDPTDASELIRAQYCEDHDIDLGELDEEVGHAAYVNDDISFYDGEEIDCHGGKRFRIRIEEIA